VALTVALPLMLASPAAASAGQQAAAPPSQAVIAAAPFEGSCGILPPKCVVRLHRPTTRTARNAAQIGGPIAAGVCAAVVIPVGVAVCVAAIDASAQAFAAAAANYYEDGDCLAVNIVPVIPPIVSPSRVKRGDHNCS